MSGLEYEGVPRTFRLTEGVRLDGDRLVFGVRVLRGEVQICAEQVYIPVNDATVIHAQLSRLLDRHSFPGLAERRERRRKARWSQ